MKVVILAGGRGSRLQELTSDIPKPMVRIGEQPILYHILSIYSRQGYEDFIIAGGYKISVIGGWLEGANLPWKVELIDTGLDTNTGGRVAKVAPPERFMMTYGDGLANVKLNHLVGCHEHNGGLCTATAVHPRPRYGQMHLAGELCYAFDERALDEGWINGGFQVIEPGALDYLHGDEEWGVAMKRLAHEDLLFAYKHMGYWQSMDTIKDVETLREELEKAPWMK